MCCKICHSLSMLLWQLEYSKSPGIKYPFVNWCCYYFLIGMWLHSLPPNSLFSFWSQKSQDRSKEGCLHFSLSHLYKLPCPRMTKEGLKQTIYWKYKAISSPSSVSPKTFSLGRMRADPNAYSSQGEVGGAGTLCSAPNSELIGNLRQVAESNILNSYYFQMASFCPSDLNHINPDA